MPKFKCDILGDFQTLCSRGWAIKVRWFGQMFSLEKMFWFAWQTENELEKWHRRLLLLLFTTFMYIQKFIRNMRHAFGVLRLYRLGRGAKMASEAAAAAHGAWVAWGSGPLPSTCTLFEKLNFCPKIQLWQNPNIFTSFSSKNFFDNFSREIKVVNS